MAQMVKNPPIMQETWILFLGWEEPLEKGVATHCSVLVWRIPWTVEPGGLQSRESQRIGQSAERLTLSSVGVYVNFVKLAFIFKWVFLMLI